MDAIPHLSLPLRVEGSSYVTNEQDTSTEAANAVQVILSCPLGVRYESPEYGIPDPTFQTQPVDVDAIAAAVSVYEPRVDAVISTFDQPDGTVIVNVEVTLPDSEDMVEEDTWLT